MFFNLTLLLASPPLLSLTLSAVFLGPHNGLFTNVLKETSEDFTHTKKGFIIKLKYTVGLVMIM